MTKMEITIVIVFVLLCVTMETTSAHGRLLDPPSRNSMWRFGFDNPVNYDDNELYCGGREIQWKTNGGKCGVCGDRFDGPRHHEAGGKYANGIITKRYMEGDVLHAAVHLTANHLGWFEFRLCPNDNPHRAVSQSCLDQYLLHQTDGSGTRFPVPGGKYNAMFDLSFRLPVGVTCSQCVLQWKYHTGNTWAQNAETSEFCLGCGPQEEFYNCADIAIDPKGINYVRNYASKAPTKDNIAIEIETESVTNSRKISEFRQSPTKPSYSFDTKTVTPRKKLDANVNTRGTLRSNSRQNVYVWANGSWEIMQSPNNDHLSNNKPQSTTGYNTTPPKANVRKTIPDPQLTKQTTTDLNSSSLQFSNIHTRVATALPTTTDTLSRTSMLLGDTTFGSTSENPTTQNISSANRSGITAITPIKKKNDLDWLLPYWTWLTNRISQRDRKSRSENNTQVSIVDNSTPHMVRRVSHNMSDTTGDRQESQHMTHTSLPRFKILSHDTRLKHLPNEGDGTLNLMPNVTHTTLAKPSSFLTNNKNRKGNNIVNSPTITKPEVRVRKYGESTTKPILIPTLPWETIQKFRLVPSNNLSPVISTSDRQEDITPLIQSAKHHKNTQGHTLEKSVLLTPGHQRSTATIKSKVKHSDTIFINKTTTSKMVFSDVNLAEQPHDPKVKLSDAHFVDRTSNPKVKYSDVNLSSDSTIKPEVISSHVNFPEKTLESKVKLNDDVMVNDVDQSKSTNKRRRNTIHRGDIPVRILTTKASSQSSTHLGIITKYTPFQPNYYHIYNKILQPAKHSTTTKFRTTVPNYDTRLVKINKHVWWYERKPRNTNNMSGNPVISSSTTVPSKSSSRSQLPKDDTTLSTDFVPITPKNIHTTHLSTKLSTKQISKHTTTTHLTTRPLTQTTTRPSKLTPYEIWGLFNKLKHTPVISYNPIYRSIYNGIYRNFHGNRSPWQRRLSCKCITSYEENMNFWCQTNCERGFCPKFLCQCFENSMLYDKITSLLVWQRFQRELLSKYHRHQLSWILNGGFENRGTGITTRINDDITNRQLKSTTDLRSTGDNNPRINWYWKRVYYTKEPPTSSNTITSNNPIRKDTTEYINPYDNNTQNKRQTSTKENKTNTTIPTPSPRKTKTSNKQSTFTSRNTTQMTSSRICRSIGSYLGQPGFDNWCMDNCRMRFCPIFVCRCFDIVPT